MLGLFQYSAANASVQAGVGRLLDADTWDRLLSGNDLEEMISVLSGTPYRDAVVEAPADIEAVERRLRSALAERVRLPMPFLRGAAKRLVHRLWRRFEIDDLIIVLRAIHNGEPARRIDRALLDLGPASRLDWQALGNAQSVSGLISRIRKGPFAREYGRALSNALDQYHRQSAIYVLEISLYLAYYREMCNEIDRLRGRDRRAARDLVGAMIDCRNLLWAYRYRIFFEMAPETILSFTVPEGGCVNAEVLQRVTTGASPGEMVRELWGSAVPDVEKLPKASSRDAVVELELIFRRFIHRKAENMLKGYPFHLGMSLAYIFLIEAEVDDLIAVMEGRVNGWPADRIRMELIGRRGRK